MIAAITRLAQRLHDDPLMRKPLISNGIRPSQWVLKGTGPPEWNLWTPPAENFATSYPPARLKSIPMHVFRRGVLMAATFRDDFKTQLLDIVTRRKFLDHPTLLDDAVMKSYGVIWMDKMLALFDSHVMPPPPRRGPPLDPDVAGAACSGPTPRVAMALAPVSTPPVATALAPAPAPLVSGVPGILLLADRLRTNEGNIRDSPDVQFELRQTVFSVRWEHPDAQMDRVQAMDQATLETKIRLYSKHAEGHRQNYRQAVKDLASAVPARLPRLHTQAAIALYAQRWAEDCLANMLAVLNSRQASAAESTAADDEMVEEPAAGSTAADDEMVEEPAEGGAAMETDSTSGGLRPIPRAFADDDTFADEDTLRAILTGYADHDTVTALLDNTLDQELAGVLWALYYDQYEGYSSGSPLES